MTRESCAFPFTSMNCDHLNQVLPFYLGVRSSRLSQKWGESHADYCSCVGRCCWFFSWFSQIRELSETLRHCALTTAIEQFPEFPAPSESKSVFFRATVWFLHGGCYIGQRFQLLVCVNNTAVGSIFHYAQQSVLNKSMSAYISCIVIARTICTTIPHCCCSFAFAR